jgi:uncharacterized protein YndB with AHSA1/START domain
MNRIPGFFRRVFAAGLLVSAHTHACAQDFMQGKQRTDREIALEVTVEASPACVYRLWTTPAGIRSFFAPKAEIGDEPGEPYTIYFAPDKDPLARSHGTAGARILAMNPGRSLAFEWITFATDADLGVNGPPVAPRELRDVRPLPTWVELTFEPVGDGNTTRVLLRHYGFGDGPLWEESHRWFTRAWAGVLNHLQSELARTQRMPRWARV